MIKKLTPDDYIRKAMQNAIETEIYILLRKIAAIAVKAVNIARELGDEYRGKSKKEIGELRKKRHTPNYIDDSGNLRNSIGFLLAYNGEVINSDFKDGEPGANAKKIANDALSGNANGITLILTAGMEYAVNVHRRGYDVLTSAELFCKKSFDEMLSKYKNR